MKDDILVYMTGLSLNKKQLSDALISVTKDPRYEIFMQESQKWFWDSLIGRHGEVKQTIYQNIINNDAIDQTDKKELEEIIKQSNGEKFFKLISEYINENKKKRISKTLFGILVCVNVSSNIQSEIQSGTQTYYHVQQLKDEVESVESTTTDEDKETPDLVLANNISNNNLEYFKIFLTNQSDNRGLIPLTSMVESSDTQMQMDFVYADGPNYKNKFIEGVKLELNTKKFEGDPNIEQVIQDEFISHFCLLVMGRQPISEALQQVNQSQQTEFNSNAMRKGVDRYQNASNLNLFGILLLSQVFLSLYKIINQKLRASEESEKKIKIFIKEKYCNHEFLCELVHLAGAKGKIEIVEKEKDPDVVISFQNVDEFEKEFVSVSSKTFIKNENDKLNAHVPINLVLSLPTKIKKEKGKKDEYIAFENDNSYLPENVLKKSKDKYFKTINVLSVGGVEHNRPLLHLINKARYSKDIGKKIGFTDNAFDLEEYANKSLKPLEQKVLLNVNSFVDGSLVNIVRRGNHTRLATKAEASVHDFKFKVTENDEEIEINLRSLIGGDAPSSSFALLYEALTLYKRLTSGSTNLNLFDNFDTENLTKHYIWEDDIESKQLKVTGGVDRFRYFVNLDIKSEEEEKVEFEKVITPKNA